MQTPGVKSDSGRVVKAATPGGAHDCILSEQFSAWAAEQDLRYNDLAHKCSSHSAPIGTPRSLVKISRKQAVAQLSPVYQYGCQHARLLWIIDFESDQRVACAWLGLLCLTDAIPG